MRTLEVLYRGLDGLERQWFKSGVRVVSKFRILELTHEFAQAQRIRPLLSPVIDDRPQGTLTVLGRRHGPGSSLVCPLNDAAFVTLAFRAHFWSSFEKSFDCAGMESDTSPCLD